MRKATLAPRASAFMLEKVIGGGIKGGAGTGGGLLTNAVSPNSVGVTDNPWFCKALSAERTYSSLIKLWRLEK